MTLYVFRVFKLVMALLLLADCGTDQRQNADGATAKDGSTNVVVGEANAVLAEVLANYLDQETTN